ncbi:PP2C family protein-serine/threonine phosphatase [Jannaschia aquimarina]|uniref:PhoB_1 protein n=1 Tax=Jannaschia aquimarina TaxID=935700 RepID=A0A0D1CQF6_9RHOB|nr:fused response regulator/phosphatase [Jannaschia aquimarina]KIT17017.1 Phosphate regulon transcriptional regulatory protein PhoB [Jannaschia aquimarina]SNS81571.1 response regulator receiver protein [Jannaschia aquimarina]
MKHVPIQSPPPPPPAVASLRALVVDDSRAQRRLVARVLEKMGIEVLQAESPVEALDIVEREAEAAPIGLIVSDWQMPGMDGPEFCRAFRRSQADRYAYFILMTAAKDARTKARGLEAGADDFVTRPIDMDELRARVRSGQRMLSMQEVLLHRNHEVAVMLHDLRLQQDATDRDLIEARNLQRSFLPPDAETFGPHGVQLKLITQGPVGGDLLGYLDLGDGRLALLSIDVSGHGIASALLTGRLAGAFLTGTARDSALFRHGYGRPDPPEAVLARINDYMISEMSTDIYFTAALAYVDTQTGEIEFCQAGHPHPLIRRADGSVDPIGEGGPPVGLLPEAPFERSRARLAPGDTLLLYSDGVTECMNSWGDMLGEVGLIEMLATSPPDPGGMLKAIEEGLRTHAEIADFDDDVSMLSFAFGDPAKTGTAR